MNNILKIAVFFLPLFGEFAQAQIGNIIPSDRRMDWRYPGVAGGITRSINNSFINVNAYGVTADGSDVSSALQTLINSLSSSSGLKVLFFYAGTYRFNSSINLLSNFIVKGEGPDKTIFEFFGDGTGIIIPGGSYSSYANIQSYTPSTKTLILTGNIGVQKDQLLEIYMHDGWWSMTDPGSYDFVGQIVKVNSVNGTTLVLEDDINLIYLTQDPSNTENRAKVRIITTTQNVGIEDIKILSTNGQNNTHIGFFCAANCWVSGVASENPGLHHIGIGGSYRIEIRGCVFIGAKKVCEGGQGYGVHIGFHSTNCLVEDNIFRELRHSMIAYGGAIRNVFGFNYSGGRHAESNFPILGCIETNGTEPDLLFHGRYPIANLAEGNVVDYIAGQTTHGPNGPHNTIFRNKVVSNDKSLSLAYGGIRIYSMGSTSLCQIFNIYGNSLTDVSDQFYDPCGIYANYNSAMDGGGTVYNDISYYYENAPQFITNAGLTWPPVGTRTGAGTTSQTNPAEKRWWSQSNMTVPAGGIIHTMAINLIQCRCPEDGSVGTYVIDGTSTVTSRSVTITACSIKVLAIPPDSHYSFLQWSDGSKDNPRTIYTSENFYAVYKAVH